MDYIKLFDQHSEYESYINSENKLLPNLSYCEDNDSVHFNPFIISESRLIATFNVIDDSSPTLIYSYSDEGPQEEQIIGVNVFDKIEIDNVNVSISDLDTAEGKYQLSASEHTVKYTLKLPTSIDYGVFYECTSLTSIEIPNTCVEISDVAFSYCSGLTSITIPNSVTTIGEQAFYNCTGLTNVTIGNGVTTIGKGAFGSCTSLTSVTIGSSVTTIGLQAFRSCNNLETITSLATTAPTIGSSTLQGVKRGGTLTVPTGSTGYDVWMGMGNYYLGKLSWTKVEQ